MNPVLEKVNRIHEDGLEAVIARTVVPYVMPDNIKQRWNCAVLWGAGPDSDTFFNLVSFVERFAKEAGVEIFCAGSDYPLHSTLCEAIASDGTPAPEQFTLDGDFGLSGMEVTFSELVVDKATLLLAASDIPQQVLDTRVELEQFYKGQGLTPMPIRNLFHITLSRVVDGDSWAIQAFVKQILELRKAVSKSPVCFRVNGIWTGSTSKLLRL